MRASIKEVQPNHVEVTYDDDEGGRASMLFFCPPEGGYVHLWTQDGRHPQICDRLARTGSTLESPSGADLLRVIRREYRAMKREHQKWNY
jgi:hypothetical protein